LERGGGRVKKEENKIPSSQISSLKEEMEGRVVESVKARKEDGTIWED